MALTVDHDPDGGEIWLGEVWTLTNEQGREIAFVLPWFDGSFTPELAAAAAYRFAASEKLLAACKIAQLILRISGAASQVTMELIDVAIADAEGRLSPIIDRPG
jgi:hypothetical protein